MTRRSGTSTFAPPASRQFQYPAADRRARLYMDAARVHVARPQNRQVAAREPRRREAREARPVALVPRDADVHREPSALHVLGDDLAAVGDVEVDRAEAVLPRGPAEGEVVDPRI